MNKTTIGLIFTGLFVLLESTQFVYFGSLFQTIDPFLFGFLVFGLTVFLFIGWTAIFNPAQLRIAVSMPKQLVAVNLGAVVTFSAYLMSVQLLEPVITYTISSGTMPITAYMLYRFGVREGEDMRNKMEASGNILIFGSILFLAVITLAGLSGFVRGSSINAIIGIVLAILDGIFFTLILVYSQRLSIAGVGPAAVLGLRLPIYVVVTGCVAYGVYPAENPVEVDYLMMAVLIGFLLSIPPLYFLQKAVGLLPTLTISALTALGPLVIFCLQILEGRVSYSFATMAGLSIYISGAILSAFGAVKATSAKNNQVVR